MKNESICNALGRVPAFVKKYAPALALGLIGILILLWPKKQTAQKTETSGAAQPAAQSLLETEQRLAALLAHIEGAGEVQVMLSLRTGAETVYQTDTKRSSGESGDTQETTTVLCTQSGSSKTPLVKKTEYPVYQGAVVVCAGADSAQVRLAIVEAVSSLTGLGSDKITVVKMKRQ